jgi:hypothetical protein
MLARTRKAGIARPSVAPAESMRDTASGSGGGTDPLDRSPIPRRLQRPDAGRAVGRDAVP